MDDHEEARAQNPELEKIAELSKQWEETKRMYFEADRRANTLERERDRLQARVAALEADVSSLATALRVISAKL